MLSSRSLVLRRLEAQLSPDMGILDPVEIPAVGSQLPKRVNAGHGEMCAKKSPVGPDLEQAAFEHCLDGRGQLGLAELRAAAPGA